MGLVLPFNRNKFGIGQFRHIPYSNETGELAGIRGLIFYNNFYGLSTTSGHADADYSIGSSVLTHTVTRSSTAPATYFDASGVMQTTTTSSIPRLTAGYYDTTGWHAAPGWLIEGASTNLLVRTDGTASADGLWTGWEVDNNGTPVAGTVSKTQVVASALSGISGAYSQRVQYTGIGADAAADIYICSTLTAVGSVVDNANVTASVWMRSLTGNTGVEIKFIIKSRNAAGGLLSSYTSAAVTPTADWARFTFTTTVTDDTASRAYCAIDISAIADGDTVDLELYAPQLEAQAYASSFIPTTTAALTRGAETTNNYPTTGNFPAPIGGNCLSFDGTATSGNDYVSVANSATGNQWYQATTYTVEAWVYLRSLGENSLARMLDKRSGSNIGYSLLLVDDSGYLARFTGDFADFTDRSANASISLNAWSHIVGVFDGSKNRISVNGGAFADSAATTGTTLDDSAVSLYIGNRVANDRTFDGFIQCVRIYRNKALSIEEVGTAYAAGRYASQPVAGCTAEYLFNEGTGTALTDGIAANNGTISGATWSKDTYSGTWIIKYRSVALPSEIAVGGSWLTDCIFSTNNGMTFRNGTAGTMTMIFNTKSNASSTGNVTSDTLTWTRYSTHTLAGVWSTDGYIRFYIDGASVGTPLTYYVVPAGVLPSAFNIMADAGQAIILESVMLYNRVLSATEIAETYGISS